MRTKKPLDVLDLARGLRAFRTLNWPEIVRTAPWLSETVQGVVWRDSIRDLPGLIGPIRDSLGLEAADPMSSYMLISYIAAAERKAGKTTQRVGNDRGAESCA